MLGPIAPDGEELRVPANGGDWYLAQGPRVIRADLRHPVLSPFLSIAVITTMLLAGALAPVAFTAARVLVIVFLAWFAIAGPGGLSQPASVIAYVLGGYAVLMVLAQARLSLVYSRLTFTPGLWALCFSYAAVIADALAWLALKKPPGGTGCAIATITLLTGFIAWIATRTVLLAVRGRLFPAP